MYKAAVDNVPTEKRYYPVRTMTLDIGGKALSRDDMSEIIGAVATRNQVEE